MSYKEDKNLQKIFVTNVYSSLSQIETVANNIVSKSNGYLQVSILGQCASLSTTAKKTLNKILTNKKQGLGAFVESSFQLGYFKHPEYGKLFIAGHLTPTFLTKVDNRKLAALPAGLIGIFRQLGLDEKETKVYLTTIKKEKFCLIIRLDRNDLESLSPLLEAY